MTVVQDHLKRERDLGHTHATVCLHHGPVDVARAAMAGKALGWRTVAVWRGEASLVYMLFEWTD